MNKKIREPRLRFPGFEDEWEDVKLGEVVLDSSYGINASAKKYNGKHRYLRITDIKDGSNELNDEKVSPDVEFLDKKYLLEEGDIVFARTGSVGKPFLYNNSFGDLYFAGYLIRYRLNKDKIFPYFLLMEVNRKKYKKWVKVHSIRSVQPGLNTNDYDNYKISLPSLPEQEKIGSFFKTLDSLIENQEKYIEKMKERKKGLLQDIFSKKIRMKDENGKEFEGEWEEVKLGEVSIRKPSKRTIKKSKDSKDSIYRYPLYNTTGIVGYKKDYDCDNAICIGKDGTIGKPFILSEESSCVATIDYILNNKKSDLYFLYLYLSIMDFRIYAVGTTIKHIYYSDYKNHKISLPSLPEQKAIGRFFKTIDKKIEKEEELLNKYKMLKKALLQDMFI